MERGRREELEADARHDRAILDSVGDGLYGLDAEGRITFVNPAAADVLGYGVDELPGRRSHPTLHHSRLDGSPSPEEECPAERALTAGLVSRGVEGVFWRKDGTPLHVEYTASPVRERGVVSGAVITFRERRPVENELRDAARDARSLLEASLDALVTISPEGKITDVNRATEEVTGVPRAELIGTDFADYFTEPEQAREGYRRVLARGSVRDYLLTLRHRSGHTTDVLYNATVYRDRAGATLGVFAAARDVTEQRRTAELLRRAQRLEAVGALAGGIAHDFNNLLTAIIGATDLLLERIPEFDPAREEAVDIQLAARKASALTRQLLTFSRRQVVQPQVLDLNEIVTGMERMLHRVIGEDIELVAVRDPALRRVQIDPGQMEQVIVNLAVNARDAMPRGGRLIIETSNVELSEEDARRYLGVRPGAHVVLSVTDTGCGMNAEVQSRLFEPFFTTKPLGKGTGLGLSTVYGIVKQAGGDVSVYSEPGRGSTFRIYLPTTDEAPTADASAAVEVPATRGTETVLLVEDDAQVRSMAARMLRSAGYTVLEAADGLGALQALAERPAPVDLVVTDMVMPHMGGPELAARLREVEPDLRVLFMSGYAERSAGPLPPGSAFLQKPFTAATLAHRVRELLDAGAKLASPPGVTAGSA